MLNLKRLTQTSDACPSQWDGELDDGTPVYIRYRWGFLRVDLNPWTEQSQTVYGQQLGEPLHGCLIEDDMLEAIAGVMRKP